MLILMMLNKRNHYLKRLYFFQIERGQYAVQDRILSEDLNLDYKRLFELAKYWEQRQCLQLFTRRGGSTEFKLSDKGKKEAVFLIQLSKKRLTYFMIIMLVISLIFISISFY